MDDGGLFKWLIVAWLARPVLTLVNFIRLNRAMATDPRRGSTVRTLVVLASSFVFAMLLLIFAINLLVKTVSGQPETAQIVRQLILFAASLAGVMAAMGFFVREFKKFRASTGGQAVRLAHFIDAPRSVRKSMRRILRSACSVRRGPACATGLINEKELQSLVYSAAQQAVLSSELNASVRDLRTSSQLADREAVRHAEQQIAEVNQYLKEVEERLAKTVISAQGLSAAITRPELEQQKVREDVQARATEERRHREARQRLSNASLAAPLRAPDDVVAFEEKVSALHIGYQEVRKISDDTLYGPTIPPEIQESQGPEEPHELKAQDAPSAEKELGKEAREIAAPSAQWLGGASRTAAKWGAKKLRERIDKPTDS